MFFKATDTRLATLLMLSLGCRAEIPSGGFQPAPNSPFSVGANVGKPVIGDLNGDGYSDIVVSYEGGQGATAAHLAVMLGDGKGGFSVRKTAATIGDTGLQVAIADFDEDGKLDVGAIPHDSNELWRLKGDGKGNLALWPGPKPVMRKGGTPHTHDLVFRDIDGDGHLDAMTTNANDNAISLALGDGKGGFLPAPASPFPAGNHPYQGLAFADFNADKMMDVAVPNVLGNAISVLLADGKSSFRLKGSWPTGPRPSVTAAADVNGDGKMDVIATHDDDALLAVLLGDGKGSFQNAPGSPFTLPQRAWGIAVADLNGDGQTDLLLGSQTSNALLLLGDGTGVFGKQSQLIPVGGNAPGQLVLADLNADGKLDVITGNHESRSVSVLLGE